MNINWNDGNKLGLIRSLAKELGVKDWKLKEAVDLYFEDDEEENPSSFDGFIKPTTEAKP